MKTSQAKLFFTSMLLIVGFSAISPTMAQQADQQAAIYENPRVGNEAMDYCATSQSGCGVVAANAFCVSKGHKKSITFKVGQDTPPTRSIQSNELCKDKSCDRMISISCK